MNTGSAVGANLYRYHDASSLFPTEQKQVALRCNFYCSHYLQISVQIKAQTILHEKERQHAALTITGSHCAKTLLTTTDDMMYGLSVNSCHLSSRETGHRHRVCIHLLH